MWILWMYRSPDTDKKENGRKLYIIEQNLTVVHLLDLFNNQTCCILKRAGPTTQNFANLRSVFLMPPAYFLSLHFFVFYCFLQVADINEVLNICVFKGTLYMPLNVFRATVEKVAEVALFSGGLHLFEATQARAVVKISTEKSRICFAFSHC